MKLAEYDAKYVCVKDIYGSTFKGRVSYENADFLECEYGGTEDGILIEDYLIYNSQIESIEEIVPHGTAELWTENLVLRRYKPEDAEQLYEYFGTDPDMYKYSGWNPYASLEMAKDTVQKFIDSYDKDDMFDYEHAAGSDSESDRDITYSWVMDVDDVVVGTIGAYDYDAGRIEVGYSVSKGWQGRGFATEALKEVLKYLTENEGISIVTAWCADENIGSVKVLERSGMKCVRTEKGGLTVGDKTYDKLIYEYR